MVDYLFLIAQIWHRWFHFLSNFGSTSHDSPWFTLVSTAEVSGDGGDGMMVTSKSPGNTTSGFSSSSNFKFMFNKSCQSFGINFVNFKILLYWWLFQVLLLEVYHNNPCKTVLCEALLQTGILRQLLCDHLLHQVDNIFLGKGLHCFCRSSSHTATW